MSSEGCGAGSGSARRGCSFSRKGERGDAARRRSRGRPGHRCPWEAARKGRGSDAARSQAGLRGWCCRRRCPWDASCWVSVGQRCPWETAASLLQAGLSSPGSSATPDLGGQEMSPWQPTPSWELALARGGREEGKEEEDGHEEPGGGRAPWSLSCLPPSPRSACQTRTALTMGSRTPSTACLWSSSSSSSSSSWGWWVS